MITISKNTLVVAFTGPLPLVSTLEELGISTPMDNITVCLDEIAEISLEPSDDAEAEDRMRRTGEIVSRIKRLQTSGLGDVTRQILDVLNQPNQAGSWQYTFTDKGPGVITFYRL